MSSFLHGLKRQATKVVKVTFSRVFNKDISIAKTGKYLSELKVYN